jgi:hypothetical protein
MICSWCGVRDVRLFVIFGHGRKVGAKLEKLYIVIRANNMVLCYITLNYIPNFVTPYNLSKAKRKCLVLSQSTVPYLIKGNLSPRNIFLFNKFETVKRSRFK